MSSRRWSCLGLVAASCGWLGGDSRGDPPPDRQCAVRQSYGCFRKIEGGTFRMGAQASDPAAPNHDPDARPEEGPVREVQLDTFWMQSTELPWGEWRDCVGAGKCPAESAVVGGAGSLSAFVAGVSWHEARTVCAFIGARLPTEAEWEYAARGTDGRRFPWGDDPPCALGTPHDRFAELPATAWTALPGCTSATKHSARESSAGDLHDMAWGHWEWTEDVYADDGYAHPPAAAPPEADVPRVMRGGSWAAEDWRDHRVAARSALPASTRSFDAGVRCAW